MSDYLTNLATRALRAAPVLLPRVASRFEAPLASQQFFSDDAPCTEAVSFHDSTVASAPATATAHSEPHYRERARRNDSDPSPPQSLRSLEQRVVNAMQRTLTPHETHTQNISPINPLRTLEQPIEDEFPHKASPGESHFATASPIAVKTVFERSAPDDSVPHYDAFDPEDSKTLGQTCVSRDKAENAGSSRSIRDAFNMEPRPFPDLPLRTELPSHLAAKIRSSGPLIAIPQLTPAPTPSQNLDRHAAAAESAPTIRVTIGRVEVRAMLPPAPAPPRATPARVSSLLTLDDYLKRRTEGRT